MAFSQSTHLTLIARLSRGQDDAAWTEFCVRYGDLIRNVARQRGLQANDVDDIMQDVLLGLRKALPGFVYDPSKGSFRGYLKAVTVHAIFAKLRQNRVRVGLPEHDGPVGPGVETAPGDEFERVWEQEWRQYHLRRAMKTIEVEFNEVDRIAFARYGIDGQPVEFVARELARSVDQVYQAKSRILKRLSALIAEQVADEG